MSDPSSQPSADSQPGSPQGGLPKYGQTPNHGAAPPQYGTMPPNYGTPGYAGAPQYGGAQYPGGFNPQAEGFIPEAPLATPAFITGILGLIPIFGLCFLAPVALIISIIGRVKVSKEPSGTYRTGKLTAGLVMSIIGCLLLVFYIGLTVWLISSGALDDLTVTG